MESKKIERLQEKADWLIGEIRQQPLDTPRYAFLQRELSRTEKEIKATRRRNAYARERHAAMTSLGLTRVRVNGRVFYE